MSKRAAKLEVIELNKPLSSEAQCFSTEAGLDAAALHTNLLEQLRSFRESSDVDPFGNPILRMALELTRLVDRNEVSPASLEQLVQHLTAGAFAGRAERLAAYAGTNAPEANAAALRHQIEQLVNAAGSTALRPFQEFRDIVEAWHYGVVFTAHPTFSISPDIARALVRQAASGKGQVVPAAVRHARHRPPEALTLDDEFAWAMEAIDNAQDALAQLHETVLDVARQAYPGEWRALVPRLVSIASWVGYDHDGRSDIGWADTLRMRLRVKLAQLQRLRDRCSDLRASAPQAPEAASLGQAGALLHRAAEEVTRQIDAASAAGGDARERAAAFARGLVHGSTEALTGTTRVVELLTEAAAAAEDPGRAVRIAALRAAAVGHGLGVAHTHFRLNATQLHNAIRRQIGLDADPGDPGHRRSYVGAINALLDDVKPVTVNIGSLMAERASARRMFMMIVQLAKYIDGETPIRFLIAETESAFTLLVALYFARLFGVDHLVEISPLFETEAAIEHGDALIDEALKSPHFRAYVQRQGRLCLQFGYSDSGRYIGQMAAAYGIERLRLKIAAVLRKHGLSDVQVVLFNTHGESIGRGGHPASLVDRLHYVAPPVSRAALRAGELAVKEEISFQGGDGYLHFLAPGIALASLSRIVETALGADRGEMPDAIYADADFAVEFFAAIRQEFSQLVDDPDYAALLGAFGTRMLDRTGSRPTRRQSETAAATEYAHPSHLRAIPNNAVLQQLGLLANTLTGVGRAATRNPERFRHMLGNSARFRRAMAMVEYAASLSDLDVLRAYVDTLDPGMWLGRSGHTRNPARRAELRAIARQLERGSTHAQLVKVFRRLQSDSLLLRDQLAGAAKDGMLSGVALPAAAREDLALLHALRIALIHRVYLLASHIPDFTPQDGLTRDDLFERLLHLDMEETVPLLREIFPRGNGLPAADSDFGEPATYPDGAAQTYEAEHRDIVDPIAAYFELMRRIGAAVTYHMGAVG